MCCVQKKKPAPKGQRSPRGANTRGRRREKVRLAEGRGLSSEGATGYLRGLRWYSRKNCYCEDGQAREDDSAFERSWSVVAGAHAACSLVLGA